MRVNGEFSSRPFAVIVSFVRRLNWLSRYLVVATIRHVPICVHWTVPAIGIFLLGAGLDRELSVASGIAAYLSMLAIHEVGHQLAGQWRGYRVIRIEIFPLHGRCILDHPQVGVDSFFVAAGGAMAQVIVAVPFILYRSFFGYTSLEFANAFIAILGFLSPCIALINLLPVPPLDGAKVWSGLRVHWKDSSSRRKQPGSNDLLKEFEEIARNMNRK